MISFIRGIIDKITANENELVRADVLGRGDDENREVFSDREIYGQYGFASAPPNGAECILVSQGQSVCIIASEDRRYKLALKDGEVALYDNNGSAVHLQTGGQILIKSSATVKVEANKVIIEANTTYLGSESAATESIGVMTGALICPHTGFDHAIAAPSVKASAAPGGAASASAGMQAKIAAAEAVPVFCPYTGSPHVSGFQKAVP